MNVGPDLWNPVGEVNRGLHLIFCHLNDFNQFSFLDLPMNRKIWQLSNFLFLKKKILQVWIYQYKLSKLAKKGFTLTGKKKTRVWKLISIYFISSSVLKEWWYCQNWIYRYENCKKKARKKNCTPSKSYFKTLQNLRPCKSLKVKFGYGEI